MASTQDLLPQSLDVGNTFGALFIAVTLAAMLADTLLTIQLKLTFFRCFTQQSLWHNQCPSFHLLSDA